MTYLQQTSCTLCSIMQTCSEYVLVPKVLCTCLYSRSWEYICNHSHRFWKLCIVVNAKFCTNKMACTVFTTRETLHLYSGSWHCIYKYGLIWTRGSNPLFYPQNEMCYTSVSSSNILSIMTQTDEVIQTIFKFAMLVI